MKKALLGVLVATILLTGCWTTVTSREYSVDEVKEGEELAYKEVEDLDTLTEWDVATIPVMVDKSSSKKFVHDLEGLHGWLWFCTLGVIPAWKTWEYEYKVTVKTPVGEAVGTCVDTERRFELCWVPYLLPFSSTHEELEYPRYELTKRVVGSLKSQWNEESVAALTAKERERIGAKRTEAESLLTQKNWQGVLALCENEKDKTFCVAYTQKALACRMEEKRARADALLALCYGMESNNNELA